MTSLIDAVTVGKRSAGQVCTDIVWLTPITSLINVPVVGKRLFDEDVSFPTSRLTQVRRSVTLKSAEKVFKITEHFTWA